MSPEIVTALSLGLLGSLHCIGMCGPIVLALPSARGSRGMMVLGRLIYNIGRVITYGFLGVIAGTFGGVLAAAGFQQTVSIALGVLVLAAVILPSKFVRSRLPSKLIDGPMNLLKSYWQRFLSKEGVWSLFVIGLLNGFLPCGLVYVAMAASAATGSISSAVVYMIVFGAGTVPVMLATALTGGLLGSRIRQVINRLIPVGAAVLAVLLILRGMSLGIPYVSPDLSPEVENHERCCPGP